MFYGGEASAASSAKGPGRRGSAVGSGASAGLGLSRLSASSTHMSSPQASRSRYLPAGAWPQYNRQDMSRRVASGTPALHIPFLALSSVSHCRGKSLFLNASKKAFWLSNLDFIADQSLSAFFSLFPEVSQLQR